MKKSFITAVLFLLPLLIFATSCNGKKYNLPVNEVTITRADGKQIVCKAEFAVKQEERNYGYMNRRHIPEGTGMLFVFQQDQILSFWMKNTPHPLSIAYIDSKGTIRNIYDMTPFSESSVISTSYVRYALEVPQGWYAKNNIAIGDKVSF